MEHTAAKIIATAWADSTDKFQNDLIAASQADGETGRIAIKAILEREGLELPEFPELPWDGTIRFVANTDKLRYIVIPERPKFTDKDMGLIVRLRQDCAKDCSCTEFGIGANTNIWEAIAHNVRKLFGGK